MKDFRDLRVWERSHGLTLAIYGATLKFPREELYGLTSQIRRCAVSIGANIAELDYELLLAKDLGYLTQPDYLRIADELRQIRKMLSSLLRKVNVERRS